MRDERCGLHLLGEKAIVAVFGAQPPLGIDDTALALHNLGIERKICQAIGFQVEHQVERGARNPVLVHRDIVAGECVVGAALRFHDPVELAGCALAVPLNIMCSKKCARPVMPGTSLRLPTRTQL